MSKRTTSFAKFVGGLRNRPASILRNVPPLRSKFDAAQRPKKGPEQEQGSRMIKEERPHPAPRPRSVLAQETDRRVFKSRLKQDDVAAHKRKFMQMRKAQIAARENELTQTYNQKRGTQYDRSI